MEFVEKLSLVAKNLAKKKNLTSNKDSNEDQIQTMSHGLVDIEEAIKGMDVLIKKLYMTVLSEDEVDEILTDIGDDLRHLIYHVRDMEYYEYLGLGGNEQ
jgi:hypothetical protein